MKAALYDQQLKGATSTADFKHIVAVVAKERFLGFVDGCKGVRILKHKIRQSIMKK